MYFIYYTQNLKFCLKTLYRELLFKAFQLWASQAFAFQLFILCNNQIPDSSKGHCRSACSSGFASWEHAVCKILPCLRCPAWIADLTLPFCPSSYSNFAQTCWFCYNVCCLWIASDYIPDISSLTTWTNCKIQVWRKKDCDAQSSSESSNACTATCLWIEITSYYQAHDWQI